MKPLFKDIGKGLCCNFVCLKIFRKMLVMNLILSVSIAVSSFVLMLLQFVRNFRHRERCGFRSGMLPWLLMCLFMTVSVNVACASTLSSCSLLCDLASGICPIMLLSTSVWNSRKVYGALAAYWILDALLIFHYILAAAGLMPILPLWAYICVSLFSLFLMTAFMVWGIWRFLYNVKVVLHSGTVWHSVCLCVETVYLMAVTFFLASSCVLGFGHPKGIYIPLAMLWLTVMALAFRIANDSAMIFSHRMERRILESLKVAAVEVPNDVTKADTAYQEIYDRIVAYFETEKPYLRSDLIIDDLVKVVFSNKLYISRAISQITGRNFCQFVNYYRIMYSVEAFRDNPELKATELANLSGFNSLVSFSMAFRLYMNENPSDWIRKERNRKAKSRLM